MPSSNLKHKAWETHSGNLCMVIQTFFHVKGIHLQGLFWPVLAQSGWLAWLWNYSDFGYRRYLKENNILIQLTLRQQNEM